jgi:hypothetical protein
MRRQPRAAHPASNGVGYAAVASGQVRVSRGVATRLHLGCDEGWDPALRFRVGFGGYSSDAGMTPSRQRDQVLVPPAGLVPGQDRPAPRLLPSRQGVVVHHPVDHRLPDRPRPGQVRQPRALRRQRPPLDDRGLPRPTAGAAPSKPADNGGVPATAADPKPTGGAMRPRIGQRMLQLAFVTVALPLAAWALEQAARRAETRDQASPASRRLRQGADFVQRWGRGPLADRLRRPTTRTHASQTGNQRHGG